MIVLGLSPLDKDATVSVVVDGEILYAAGEERFSRKKQHAGFPRESLESALNSTGIRAEEVDVVAYPFLTWRREMARIRESLKDDQRVLTGREVDFSRALLRTAKSRVPTRKLSVHGLSDANQKVTKPLLKELAYYFVGGVPFMTRMASSYLLNRWIRSSRAAHKKWQIELERGLTEFGLESKLKRYEHHLSHASNAYYSSGFGRALIVTLDGYGSGLCGSVSIGDNGTIRRIHNFPFMYSLGTFYENVTSALGFSPDRHAGKIVGLAAYGDPHVLYDVLASRVVTSDGSFAIRDNLNCYISRYLSGKIPMIDIAAAYQNVLEVVAAQTIKYWIDKTGCNKVVLSGGVAANVKMNQRIHEIEGVDRIFIYPNMGDGGCGTGLGLLISHPGGSASSLESVYLGPHFPEKYIRKCLDDAGLSYARPQNLAAAVADLIFGGSVVGRFDGRMEYGPRALGNRSVLYHAREPGVNQWLNKRLGRTEFMPFAPVTLFEAREKCFEGVSGAEHPAEYMAITFNCTPWMKAHCPAAVHVDGTARPQLIRRELNPGYYDIVKEYDRRSGIPCLINTSFNMHEEPIVCCPEDAIRAFLKGRLDALAIGPYLVMQPLKACD